MSRLEHLLVSSFGQIHWLLLYWFGRTMLRCLVRTWARATAFVPENSLDGWVARGIVFVRCQLPVTVLVQRFKSRRGVG